MYTLRLLNPETRATLEALREEQKSQQVEKKESKGKEKATAKNAAHYSTGAVAQSLTSTVSAPVTENEAAILDADVLRYRQIKKKGELIVHLCS